MNKSDYIKLGVDDEIISAIISINRLGIKTFGSCAGFGRRNGTSLNKFQKLSHTLTGEVINFNPFIKNGLYWELEQFTPYVACKVENYKLCYEFLSLLECRCPKIWYCYNHGFVDKNHFCCSSNYKKYMNFIVKKEGIILKPINPLRIPLVSVLNLKDAFNIQFSDLLMEKQEFELNKHYKTIHVNKIKKQILSHKKQFVKYLKSYCKWFYYRCGG